MQQPILPCCAQKRYCLIWGNNRPGQMSSGHSRGDIIISPLLLIFYKGTCGMWGRGGQPENERVLTSISYNDLAKGLPIVKSISYSIGNLMHCCVS